MKKYKIIETILIILSILVVCLGVLLICFAVKKKSQQVVNDNTYSSDSSADTSDTSRDKTEIEQTQQTEVSGKNAESIDSKTSNSDTAIEYIKLGDLLNGLESYRLLTDSDKDKVSSFINENTTDFAHSIAKLSVEKGMSRANECIEEMSPDIRNSEEYQQSIFGETMNLLNTGKESDAKVLIKSITNKQLIEDFYTACNNMANDNVVKGVFDKKTSGLYNFLPKETYPDAHAYKALVDFVISVRETPNEIPIHELPIIINSNAMEYCPDDCKQVLMNMKSELEQMSGCYTNGVYYYAIKNYRIGTGDERSNDIYGLDSTYNSQNGTFYVLISNIKKAEDGLDVDGKVYKRISESECPVTFNKMDIDGSVAIVKHIKKVDKPDPYLGMSEEEMEQSSWGKPQKKNISEHIWGTHEQWVYHAGRYVYFENGVLTCIQRTDK